MRHALVFLSTVSVLAASPAYAAQAQHTLQGQQLSLRDIIATVDVRIVPGATSIQLVLDGEQSVIDRVRLSNEGNKAVIGMQNDSGIVLLGSEANLLRMTVTLPPGTALDMKGFAGTATIGDLDAPVALDTNSGNITIGRVPAAAISIKGSGDITVGDVATSLGVKILGSGDLKMGTAGATAVSLQGSGDADIAGVSGGLTVKLSGSGDVTIATLDGPTQIRNSGSGDVAILNGNANPFAVSSSGSGDVIFIGTASNAQVSTSGSGGVCLAATDGATALAGEDITVDPNACRAEAND